MRRIAIAALMMLCTTPALAQGQTPAAAQPPAAQPATAPPADAAQPVPQAVVAAPANPPMTGPRLLIATSMGDITVQLDSVRAPKSVASILRFVKDRHYDGTVFYRVAHGFVIQMGSWDAHMKGRGYKVVPLPLEANNGLSNLRGTLALGRGAAPDSAGAEFFINLADNTPLDRKADDPGNTTGYAVFGQVTDGMSVVDAIGAAPTGDGGPMPGQWPLTPIVVTKVTVLK